MRQLVVLKPSGPMRLGNANFKIKIGQVAPHPGYPVDPKVLETFDDTPEGRKDAIAAAARYIEMKNIATRHGVTDRQTLANIYAKNAKTAPTAADRKKAFEEAKLLTKEGLVKNPDISEHVSTDDENAENTQPVNEESNLVEENKKLREELDQLKEKKRKLNPRAYLDQNTRTVVKRVKSAVQKKQLKKRDVEEIIETEEKGQARKGILDKLKNLIKDDVIFGKLFK